MFAMMRSLPLALRSLRRPFQVAKLSTLREPKMMCFQCEQTSAGTGCTTIGICSKTPALAGLQDLQVAYNLRLCQLGLALGSKPLSLECARFLLDSTFATLTNVNFDEDRFESYLKKAEELVQRMELCIGEDLGWAAVPRAAPGLPSALPQSKEALRQAALEVGLLARSDHVGDEDVFGLVEMATYGLKGLCAYMAHAERIAGADSGVYSSQDRDVIFAEIFRIGSFLARAGSCPTVDQYGTALDEAVVECMAVGELNLKVMKLLDAAHCHVLGNPEPATVARTSGGRHSILVSGHDLGVLKSLLEQTEGKGVDVYTHGEMLPAHGYPGLRKFEHLRGHFGTHWGNQLQEFRDFPGAILMTSNCLRPPTRRYASRLWTCGPVGFKNIPNIESDDFGPIISRALDLPVFDAASATTGVQVQRPELVTGFGHGFLTGLTDKIVDAIKQGELKDIFVIGGCDGTESSRSYFTDLALSTPSNSIILTMGCGKFRLNGDEHGTVAGLPRLLDMGQCNDAYSAIVVAGRLAEALGCSINDLPMHFAISWFEQKAVAVLLSMLYLDLKNIRIGPAVPAFLTPRVQGILFAKFGLSGINKFHEDQDLLSMLESR